MSNKSLTLIELLISLTIFAIVAVAIYSVFSTGIIGWRKGEIAISCFHEIRLSLDRIAREIKNQVPYNGIRLAGTADELYVISLIPYPEEGKSEYMRLAKIKYLLEENENGLSLFRERIWVPYLEGSEEIDKTKLISSIKSFNFQYGEKVIEDEETHLNWQETWGDSEKTPAAIRLNLNIAGENTRDLSRVIYLPYGEEF